MAFATQGSQLTYSQASLYTSTEIDAMLEAGAYTEGEVIAVVRADLAEQVSASGFRWPWEELSEEGKLVDSGEELMSTSLDAAEEGTGAELAEAADVAASTALSEVKTASDDAVKIISVTSSTLSTRQLIEQLACYERVISVEPNYTWTIDEGTESSESEDEATASSQGNETGSAGTAQTAQSTLTALSDETDYPDLTNYQWGFSSENNKTLVRPNATHADGFDMGIPNWNDSSKTNSSGVIAVLDSGIDYTNPDLDDVMYALSDEENAGTNGGKYGYNTVDDNGDPKDVMGHGTHCAGIIAAEWNNFGTSGVCNGTKLIGVRAANSSGVLSAKNIVSGYNYLSTIKNNGVDLVAVNDSWGLDFFSIASINAAMAQLGEQGVVSVIAAGNSGLDNDTIGGIQATCTANPYTVVVSSAKYEKASSGFSSYGKYTSDVYGPGSEIMSTYPSYTSAYYCGVTDDNPIYRNTFEGAASLDSMRFVNAEGASLDLINKELNLPSSIQEVTTDTTVVSYADNATFDAGTGSLKFTARPDEGVMYETIMYIPVKKSELDNIKYFGITGYLDGDFDSMGSIFVDLVWQLSDGKLGTGLDAKTYMSSGLTMAYNEWMTLSFDISSQKPKDDDGATLYTLESGDEDTVYIAAIVGNTRGETYVDALSLGSQRGNWTLVEGTSMATPAVAGAAGVAANTSEYKALSGADQAKYIAHYLKAHVTHADAFANTCRQGGMIDLSATETTPVVDDVSQNGQTITITGDYFGSTAGTVSLAGALCAVESWDNTQIIATVPDDVSAGASTVSVTAANGNAGTTSIRYQATNVKTFPSVYQNPSTALGTSISTGIYNSSFGSYTSSMTMLNGKIYAAFLNLGTEYYDTLGCFDVASNTWQAFSIATERTPSYAKIVACDNSIWEYTVEEDAAGTNHLHLYSYDPSSGKTTSYGTICNADGTECRNFANAALAEYEGALFLVGGFSCDSGAVMLENNIARLSIADGTATVVPEATFAYSDSSTGIAYGFYSPQVVSYNGSLYVAGGSTASNLGTVEPNATFYKLTRSSNGEWTMENLSSVLPANLTKNSKTAQPCFGLTATSEGIFLVGASVTDSSGLRSVNDTYVLYPQASSFQPWGKVYNLGNSLFTLAVSDGKNIYALTETAYAADTNGCMYFAGSAGADEPVAVDISDATVTVKNATYTGKAQKPAVTVKVNGTTLKAGTDYTLTYKNNKNAGTGFVLVKGKSSYYRTASQTFTVAKAKTTIKVAKAQLTKTVKRTKVKKGAAYTTKVKATGTHGTPTYAKVKGAKKLSVDKYTGKIKVAKGTKKGTYKIWLKVKSPATANYKAASKTVKVTVRVK